METKPKAPGLNWVKGVPYWRASRAAIDSGYPVKNVNLSVIADNHAALDSRCHRLTAEMNEWLHGGDDNYDKGFDGTIRAAIELWQRDPSSPYQNVEDSTRHPYDIYASMIITEVGTRRIDAVDGRDLRRWHDAWSAPSRPGGKPTLAKARMAIIVLKNALTFGSTCRKPGCAELRDILHHIKFAAPQPRTAAPTAAEIVKAREAAHAIGHAAAALAYALQFEGAIRQWDVTGKWVPISDKRPSSIIAGRKKWIGPLWSQIDDKMIFRYTPSKTLMTSGKQVVLDLNRMPMVLEELARVPGEMKGPLIVNPKTGLPYTNWYFGRVWDQVRKAAGISPEIWNRDARAGAVTEGRQADASLDDLAKVAGHANKRTTSQVYDRDHLEAARRVAQARVTHRNSGQNGR